MKNNYKFSGKVIQGKKRGKRLGFPTANIAIDEKIPEGVYLSIATIEEKEYQSLTFVGRAETFDENFYHAETYILSWPADKSLYGQEIKVGLIKKIRENKKFASEQKLAEQMQKDKKEAQEFFLTNKV
ncbi:MAG: riboflavin kinase [Candidatus Levyibacteriota bacterium]